MLGINGKHLAFKWSRIAVSKVCHILLLCGHNHCALEHSHMKARLLGLAALKSLLSNFCLERPAVSKTGFRSVWATSMRRLWGVKAALWLISRPQGKEIMDFKLIAVSKNGRYDSHVHVFWLVVSLCWPQGRPLSQQVATWLLAAAIGTGSWSFAEVAEVADERREPEGRHLEDLAPMVMRCFQTCFPRDDLQNCTVCVQYVLMGDISLRVESTKRFLGDTRYRIRRNDFSSSWLLLIMLIEFHLFSTTWEPQRHGPTPFLTSKDISSDPDRWQDTPERSESRSRNQWPRQETSPNVWLVTEPRKGVVDQNTFRILQVFSDAFQKSN